MLILHYFIVLVFFPQAKGYWAAMSFRTASHLLVPPFQKIIRRPVYVLKESSFLIYNYI